MFPQKDACVSTHDSGPASASCHVQVLDIFSYVFLLTQKQL